MHEFRFIVFSLLEPFALACWVLLGLNALLWRQKVAATSRWLCSGITAFFMLAACPFVANQLQRQLEDQALVEAKCAPPPPGSVFVVLAGGIDRSTADKDDVLRLSNDSLRRMVAGVLIAETVPESVIVLSGGTGNRVREADLMRSLALTLGMPSARLLLERESRTTYENAVRVKALLVSMGDRPAYLVTSAMHMPRAAAVFRSQGLRICAYPVDFQHREPEWADAIIPRLDSMQKTKESLREMLAYWAYRVMGYIDAPQRVASAGSKA